MWTLFLPKFDVLRQLLTDGVLGEVRTVLADMGESFDPSHRIFDAALAGGPLLDLGTYPTTFAHWVLGVPDSVAAVGTPAPNGINGQLGALLTWSDRMAEVHCTILGESPTTATISGDSAVIEIERNFYRPGNFILRDGAGNSLRWEEPAIDHAGLHFEAAEVARCIAAGATGSPLRPFSATIETLEIMDRIRESAGIDFSEAVAARG